MTIKFTITRLKDPNFNKEVSFQNFPISIGRDSTNEITLEDKSKIISRVHAKLTEENGSVKLFDLGSRNSTLLNGEKIESQIEYDISEADSFTIGDYKITVLIQFEKEDIIIDDDRTMIFKSPFADEVTDFANCLEKLSKKYSKNEDKMRDEYLKMDLLTNFSQLNFDNISPFVSEYFFDKSSLSIEENKWGNISNQIAIPQERKSQSQILENKSSQENILENNSYKTPTATALDILLESISNLIQGFWHFRQEFFGVTIYQSIPVTSLEELKKFLFDPSLSNDESNRRLELFNEELKKIQSHQVGLLDGYKDSINDGIENILNELNPELLVDKINSQNFKIGSINIPYKYIPFYVKIKSMQLVKSIHKKLQIDINAIERKHFRPAFMKGYQKRINI